MEWIYLGEYKEFFNGRFCLEHGEIYDGWVSHDSMYIFVADKDLRIPYNPKEWSKLIHSN